MLTCIGHCQQSICLVLGIEAGTDCAEYALVDLCKISSCGHSRARQAHFLANVV
jgi:hypothetical protein